uniref:G_PROTEIN_RECEP_F1_2 domain-containing protein n=1 Tax=Panagrellus redivivus TaxID=6233 RepID=A0A7E4V2N0_PANRE
MPPLFGILVFIDEALASIFSYICNICLLYCVLKNYKPELKRLNMILIQNITLDLILGMFPIISGMWMAFVDGKVYVLMTGLVKYTSYNFACYSYCMYCAVLCLCVFAFPMQFYFRYKTLCSTTYRLSTPKPLKYFHFMSDSMKTRRLSSPKL